MYMKYIFCCTLLLLVGIGVSESSILDSKQNVREPEAEETIWDLSDSHRPAEQPNALRLWLTVSSRHRFIEVSWQNAPALPGDFILLTSGEPHSFEKVRMQVPLAAFDSGEGSGFVPLNGYTTTTTTARPSTSRMQRDEEAVVLEPEMGSGDLGDDHDQPKHNEFWISNGGRNDVVVAIQPKDGLQWYTTGVHYDYALSRAVTVNTTCYGYWASYINATGGILAGTCLRAHPRWMQELRSVVGGLRMRDLFIPGTHDSGAYARAGFNPLLRETVVTKYALTQDEDVRGQLMHGVRYLDIRVGYYRNTPELFFINHGITRQRPLLEVIEQVRDFVLQTNEIVIFGLKEFPVGFGKTLSVHRLLVSYLQEHFGELIVHPSLTWRASLRDIWSRKQNVILAYDRSNVVQEYPHTLFGSVEQRWGDVKTWPKLESYLRSINSYDVSRLSSRPVADMAELTPDGWGVILDQYGGLRTMADNVNWRLSYLYAKELGANANIVAVDFLRGTTIVETALDWNKRKIIY